MLLEFAMFAYVYHGWFGFATLGVTLVFHVDAIHNVIGMHILHYHGLGQPIVL